MLALSRFVWVDANMIINIRYVELTK